MTAELQKDIGAAGPNLRFGVDLVTFFHPGFWGVDGYYAIVTHARANPRAFWDRLLDGIEASGVTGVEPTFSPFNWRDAVATYGSVDGFAHELSRRGLSLASGFFAELESGTTIADPDVQARILASARDYAAFISACGGDAMVIGLPMRKSPDAEPPLFVDLKMAEGLADFLNRLGALVAREGVRLALHTEAHSMFSTARDVDLFLMLTDPVYVSFCPDTAHLIVAGADPLEVVKRHKERMVIAHWKDALGAMPADTPIDEAIHERHRPYFCGFGVGRVDWHAWVRLLRDVKFRGWAILELDAAPDPIADIAAGRAFIQSALSPIYA
jgi:sugar phosphate isomerase/epimerase